MTFYRVPFSTLVARNLAVNPSFEADHPGTGVYGWEVDTLAADLSTSPRPDGTVAPYGSQCLSWSTGGGSGTTSIRTALTTPAVALSSAATFYYKFQARKSSAAQTGATVEVRVSFYDASGVLIGAPAWVAAAGSLSNTTWLAVAGSSAVPVGVASYRVGIRVLTANGIGNFYLDGVIFSTANVPFFDGNTADIISSGTVTDDRYYYWTQGPDVSESVQTAAVAGDRLDADLDVVLPFTATRELRTAVGRLLESDSTRATYIVPGPRTGSYRAVFTDPDDVTAAQQWFAGAAQVYFKDTDTPATTHANMLFTVAEGGLELRQREDVNSELLIPFVEQL